jgi:hypothetical protein
VLALFSNQIIEVEALESLKLLEVLRIGNNKITNKKVHASVWCTPIDLTGGGLFAATTKAPHPQLEGEPGDPLQGV